MRVAVVATPGSWYVEDLRRAAGERHQVEVAPFPELAASLNAAERPALAAASRDLTVFDVFLVRTMPPASLEQVIFRMDVLGRLEAAGKVVVNPPKAIEAAVDKYLTSARLAAAGLPIPRTMVCQGRDEGVAAFEALGGDVVLKPLFGGEGRGIARLQNLDVAARAFQTLSQLGSVLYLQEFIPHEGFDVRAFLLGDRLLAMRRSNPSDWRTNVSRGAMTEKIELTDEEVDLARRSAAAVGAPLAGVDLLTARDGRRFVLEVNAAPGWKALAATLEVDVALLVLDYLETVVRGRAEA
ncbi:MAG: RimK family alpha-L-glutamate ligase [Pirellulales bacterium]|nr:RimK family alpha-L-glutamate ligase [Pirellulales bacterium]